MARLLNLEVNTSGAWKRVTESDLDQFEGDSLREQIAQLLGMSTYERITARLVIPGDTAPLWIWNKTTGWAEWRGPAA